jgi:hypothetical protein
MRTRLPLSGAEPTFGYKKWGDIGRTRDNCYDYAFGDDARRNEKSVPGNHSGKRSTTQTSPPVEEWLKE